MQSVTIKLYRFKKTKKLCKFQRATVTRFIILYLFRLNRHWAQSNLVRFVLIKSEWQEKPALKGRAPRIHAEVQIFFIAVRRAIVRRAVSANADLTAHLIFFVVSISLFSLRRAFLTVWPLYRSYSVDSIFWMICSLNQDPTFRNINSTYSFIRKARILFRFIISRDITLD